MTFRTRFAPSPTGPLHLGHAYSALVAAGRARTEGGEFHLRIEDTDSARSRPEWEAAIYEDLHWLGLSWKEPVWRQSDRLSAYDAALDRLTVLGLTYPCCCTRADIRQALSAPHENASDAVAPSIYPGTCRTRKMKDREPHDAVRLNLSAALAHLGTVPNFIECGPLWPGTTRWTEDRMILEVGDIVLFRRDVRAPAYHLSVVVDDAAQGITQIVRGMDLFDATPIQRSIQVLLQLPEATYWHHDLMRDDAGRRLSKRDDARALRAFRDLGATPADIRVMVGL